LLPVPLEPHKLARNSFILHPRVSEILTISNDNPSKVHKNDMFIFLTSPIV
jgi:hypothetical protein